MVASFGLILSSHRNPLDAAGYDGDDDQRMVLILLPDTKMEVSARIDRQRVVPNVATFNSLPSLPQDANDRFNYFVKLFRFDDSQRWTPTHFKSLDLEIETINENIVDRPLQEGAEIEPKKVKYNPIVPKWILSIL